MFARDYTKVAQCTWFTLKLYKCTMYIHAMSNMVAQRLHEDAQWLHGLQRGYICDVSGFHTAFNPSISSHPSFRSTSIQFPLMTKQKLINFFLINFQSLLSDPNPNSPANSMAAQLYKENRREYEKRVKACVEQSFID